MKKISPPCKTLFRAVLLPLQILFCIKAAFAQVTPPSAPSVPMISPVSVQPVSAVSSNVTIAQPVPSQNQQPAQNQQSAQSASKKALSQSSVSAASLSTLAASLFGGASQQNPDALSSLLGNRGNSLLSGVGGTANPAANLLLEQILVKLEEIQQGLASLPISAVPVSQQSSAKADATAQILRFTVNNYSVLDTCRSVFFSKRSKDGNFLLTGDRKYLSDGKTRDETFYMLFKKTGMNTYEVACSVSQDYENQYSFLYQLSQKVNVTARQTGNFITVRVNEPAWKLDLLIDASDLGVY